MHEGGCQCGAIRYRASGEARHNAICHCADCRASSGAPMVAWLCIDEDGLELLQGEPATYVRESGAERQFCPACGTGLFYRNAKFLPGQVDIQTATLDDPAAAPPQAQVQCAERLGYVKELADLPEFEHFPAPE